MILTVARKEFVTTLRDGRIMWSAAILAVMLLAALVTAGLRYTAIAAERSRAQEIVDAQFRGQGEKNPHAAAHYGLYAFKAVTPLSFFDTGVTSFTGVSIWLEAHKQNMAEGEPARDSTAVARFGELTVAFTLQTLLPLLVILLAFAAFVGEREQGTLRQALSMGVSPRALLFGKALGAGLALGVFLVPVLGIGLIALAAAGGAALLGHALVIALVYALYAAVFLFLTLAVSAAADSTRTALVAMVGFWAVANFVLPKVAADVAARAAPTPTLVAFQKAVAEDMANGLDGASPDAVVAQRREQTLKLYKADSLDKLPINFQGVVFSLQEQLGNAVFDKHYGALSQVLAAQTRVYEFFSLFSPRLAISFASMQLAGTGLADHEDYARQAEQFRRAMIEKMNQAITFKSGPNQTDYRAGPELWAQVGSFAYRPPGLGTVVARIAPNATVLVLWLVGAIVAALLAVQRLRVTVA
jgi:ABC-2 type transport system permease protein